MLLTTQFILLMTKVFIFIVNIYML